jgi:hypothetical protein
MTGKPVLAASARANVLFPEPANPVTTTRSPSVDDASLIDASVPHLPQRDGHGSGRTASRPRADVVEPVTRESTRGDETADGGGRPLDDADRHRHRVRSSLHRPRARESGGAGR